MGFFNKVTIQKEIKELSDLERGSKKYLDKYNKILKDVVNLKKIYTVVSRNATDEEIKNNVGQVFFGLNNNIPTMWLFTEEKIAKEYADYYKFKREDLYLIRKVTPEELLMFSYYAMFSGVCQLIVDEARDFLVCNLYDLVNECFVNQGSAPVLTKDEYVIMDAIKRVKFSDKKFWVVPGKGTIGENIIFNNFVPVVEEDFIKVFVDEADSKNYSKKQGNENYITIDLDIIRLQEIIKVSIDNNIKSVDFIFNNGEVKMSISKLYNILQRMNE